MDISGNKLDLSGEARKNKVKVIMIIIMIKNKTYLATSLTLVGRPGKTR